PSYCFLTCTTLPPRPPLFPYTTLFRSMGSLALPALAAKKQAPPRPSLLLIVVDRLPAWMTGPYGNKEVRTPTLDHLAQTGTRFQDRKSTRLNSSHDQISYAVFCLKKKK